MAAGVPAPETGSQRDTGYCEPLPRCLVTGQTTGKHLGLGHQPLLDECHWDRVVPRARVPAPSESLPRHWPGSPQTTLSGTPVSTFRHSRSPRPPLSCTNDTEEIPLYIPMSLSSYDPHFFSVRQTLFLGTAIPFLCLAEFKSKLAPSKRLSGSAKTC